MKIEFWNPTPIFFEDCNLHELGIIDEIKNKEKIIESFFEDGVWDDNVSSTFNKCLNIIDFLDLTNLKNFIKSKSNLFLNELNLTTKNIEIYNSWFNKIFKYGFQDSHQHGSSIISGVLYYDYSNLNFEEGITFVFNKPFLSNNNTFTINYEYVPGRLILFPGSVFHKVKFKKTNGIRKSLSFNINCIL